MKQISNISKLCKIFLLFLAHCYHNTFYVEKIIDGDTFVIQSGYRVRILGIDAPEKGDPFWEDSKKMLQKIILHKKVRLEYGIRKYDKYNRILAYVFVDGEFVNQKLVEEGMAWVYVIPPNFKYSHRLIIVQERAERLRKGIWRRPYYVASKRSKKFHAFYCPSAKKIISKNKRIFRSKQEALKEGYKPSKDCNP